MHPVFYVLIAVVLIVAGYVYYDQQRTVASVSVGGTSLAIKK
ncbi:MAG TPA: hypothetical protein VMB21_21190 [Candidatus Limnocylindria bacterium]|nr:hypothetical protein [Candidatus Limnocylindria bacterium]